jgi:hypothetical protein
MAEVEMCDYYVPPPDVKLHLLTRFNRHLGTFNKVGTQCRPSNNSVTL